MYTTRNTHVITTSSYVYVGDSQVGAPSCWCSWTGMTRLGKPPNLSITHEGNFDQQPCGKPDGNMSKQCDGSTSTSSLYPTSFIHCLHLAAHDSLSFPRLRITSLRWPSDARSGCSTGNPLLATRGGNGGAELRSRNRIPTIADSICLSSDKLASFIVQLQV
jgi:hypothetical protein